MVLERIGEALRKRVEGSQRIRAATFTLRLVLDLAGWTLAVFSVANLRVGFEYSATFSYLLRSLPIVAMVQVVVGISTGLYRRRWRYGSFDEVAALVATSSATTLILFLLNQILNSNRPIPQSAVIVGGFFGLSATAGVRYLWRLALERVMRPRADGSKRVLVYGAGLGGTQAIGAMLSSPQSMLTPVGIIDDDPAKSRLSIMGVPVLGNRSLFERESLSDVADVLLIAIPSLSSEAISEIQQRASGAGLGVKILPSVDEILGRSIVSSDIRDVTEEDLLGRHQYTVDLESIAGYISDRRIVVTGAGGSIGSEICRQVARLNPERLVMLDRDESALHAVDLSISGNGLLQSKDLVLADIRDVDAVGLLFDEIKPDVVFHAAALKHLPLLEMFPNEAFKTNVVGTFNVLSAAEKSGVKVFVNISTDKAANPISVLGYSKRVCERMTASFALDNADSRYISVRFGNVVGSRGSVLTTFRSQIESGGPLSVTDPEVTRYFMTIGEAVQLVIQAGAIGQPGEVLILDMGTPVKILDVAKNLIAASSKALDIHFTGLRPGEKLHEELFGPDEVDERPVHPRISHVPVAAVDPKEVLSRNCQSKHDLAEACNLGLATSP